MCDPVTAALTLASTAYGLSTTRQNAKRQERANRAAHAEQEEQLRDQLSSKANSRAKIARRERARLRAQSATSGLTGTSLTTVLNDVDFQAGTDIATLSKDSTNARNNSRTELQSRLNSIKQPDYVGAALNTGLQLYGDYQQNGGG